MRFVIIILTVVAVSCGQADKTTDNTNLKSISIDFANAQMNIPDTYQQTSFPEYRDKLLKSDRPRSVIETSLYKLDQMEAIPFKIILFTDTSNFENTIWLQEGEYIKLNKSVAQQYMNLLGESLKKQWTPQGIKYSQVDRKYFDGKTADVIKLKYKLTDDLSTRYSTQYMISSKSKTWAITVSNENDQDYEGLVKHIKIK